MKERNTPLLFLLKGAMEPNSQLKSKPQTLYIVIGILCLIVFAGLICWQYQKPERKSDANEQNQTASPEQPSDNNQIEQPPVSTSENLYRQGAKRLDEQNYSEAIKYFDQAIAENPYEPQYYSDKSGAQYNLGQKDQAIATLRQGSSLNPDSDLLKSKLDVLTKQFDNSDIDAARE